MKIALVGTPNVGKSLIFYHLTGKYATVSNYPGTSVDITRGKVKGLDASLIDTPGLYSFLTITEEERVAKRILFDERPDVVVHVVDAKNIERKLSLTLQLIDACFNTILVLNAMDEAERLGMHIDVDLLQTKLGVPVIPTIATQKKGIGELKKAIWETHKEEKKDLIKFNSGVEKSIEEVSSLLHNKYPVDNRFLASLLLMGDKDSQELIEQEKNYENILNYIQEVTARYPHSLSYEMAMQVENASSRILQDVVSYVSPEKGSFMEKLSEWSMHPIASIPMAIIALALLYLFAGVLGAQILVDLLEGLFEEYINSSLNSLLQSYVPYYWARELIGGDFGIVTLGLRYAFAIILPIVSIFFFIFSIIEDSGYLPRLAVLMDRLFKMVGLSGKAVIPLVLGLGCGTMATIVTRVLETRREKVIATLMLAVGIPCSAQLGVIMAIAPSFSFMALWASIIIAVLLSVGYVASKFITGPTSAFIIEIPPIRIPALGNVVTKTLTRLEWYFKEVIPIFIVASMFIWVGRLTGVFNLLVEAIAVPTTLIGLPKEAAVMFLFGFFRRDYGAAGLFDLANQGLLSYPQIVVAMVTLTLFVPCIAQCLVMIKERGVKVAIGIFMVAILIAFGVGYLTHNGLNLIM